MWCCFGANEDSLGMGNSNSRASYRKTIFFTPSDIQALNIPTLSISKQVLDFNQKDEACPINQPVYDEVDLTNISRKKVRFKFDPVFPDTCELKFTPSEGTVQPNKTKKVRVTLTLTDRVNLNFPVTIRIAGAESLFLNLRVAGEQGVFGVDPTTLEMVEDSGHQVPAVLAQLKKAIIHHNGINSEGIFRLAGEQSEVHRIKELLNTKKFEINSTFDVNAIASLIKIWYRDLPVPILNALPQERIMNWSDTSDCVDAYNTLPEPQKTLLDWLLDFLAQVAGNASVNKMTSQNLAIVVAPNLYDISTPNPLEGLVLSQKCAQFLNHVLNSHIQTIHQQQQ